MAILERQPKRKRLKGNCQVSTKIGFPIKQLLTFYDDPSESSGATATAITAVIGEELGAGLLVDYFRAQGLIAEVLNKNVTQGTSSGVRLDRWVKVTNKTKIIYYQVEIKNWAAYAINGKRIAVNADANQLKKHKIERWGHEWDGVSLKKPKVAKVLTPMMLPEIGGTVEPLVCYWDAMHPNGEDTALFFKSIKNKNFKRVWIFSMSAHLRNLLKSGQKVIKIDSPIIAKRLEWLNRLTTKQD